MKQIAGLPMSEAKRSITIIVNHLPYSELYPNFHGHWSERAKAAKIARVEMGWMAKAAIQERGGNWKPIENARISYEFTVSDWRKRDHDNLVAAMKSSQDGLIDAGVMMLDDAKHLQMATPVVKGGTEDRTVITVEEKGKCRREH